MGSSEMDKTAKEKEAKTPPAATTTTINNQDPSSATSTGTLNPPWSGFQAYSPMPPPGYMASSPQAHPYMWGVQHMMPPYGTPPHPYVAMYPHGGMYAHPSMPPGSYPFSPFAMPSPNGIPEPAANTAGSSEADGKPSEPKEKLPIKRSKGSLGSLNMITGKNNETSITSAANGVYSKRSFNITDTEENFVCSADVASDGTTEGSDANSQSDSHMKSGGGQDSLEETSQNDNSAHGSQEGGPNHSIVTQTRAMVVSMQAGGVPGTNLNIGMDYWGTPASGSIAPVSGKVPASSVTGGMVNSGSREGVQSQPWLQDERELKRQRRKQSNRESARRSRLRKQAECDELAQRAETLKEENVNLRLEVNRIRSEYEQLQAENTSLKEKLGETPGNEDGNKLSTQPDELSSEVQPSEQAVVEQNAIDAVFQNLSIVTFDEVYSPLFGDANGNLILSPSGHSVRLLLDRFTGAGFISSKMYQHGFYSANIKLPSDYTAGTSNVDVFEKTHDELDFEFLGNVEGKPWRFQTNIYGHGSTSRGREERYRLWFDPSKEFHRYSILWTVKNIIFYIDDVPIREVLHNEEMGLDYPSKPMSLYATIWDASSWATSGGRYKVNYKYAPFVSEFKDFVQDGCPVDPIQEFSDVDCTDIDAQLEANDYSFITPRQRAAMRRFRERYMYYSYCYDNVRYPVRPPECVIIPTEQQRFRNTGRLKFGGSHRARKRRSRRRSRNPIVISAVVEAGM
ncbi:hypothetical protein ACFE04_012283 [Oxalis oulophora]